MADRRNRSGRGDAVTVGILSLAGFLVVLALLGTQLRAATSSADARRRPVLVRRIYRTTVDERVIGAVSRGPSSSTSESSSGASAAAPLATRTS